MRLVLMALLGIPLFISALTLDDIQQALVSHPVTDTLDMRVEVVAASGTFSSSTKMHLITKSLNKTWVELESPMGTQRFTKNGLQYKVEDVKSGKVVYPNQAPMGLNSVGNVTNPNSDILRKGQYTQPVSKSDGIFELKMIIGSDTTVKARIVKYDKNFKQIVGIDEVSKDDDTTNTIIKYSKGSSGEFPKKIEIVMHSKGAVSNVTVSILSAIKPKNLGDALFQVNQ